MYRVILPLSSCIFLCILMRISRALRGISPNCRQDHCRCRRLTYQYWRFSRSKKLPWIRPPIFLSTF
jgi:hypothetical protein